MKSSFVLSSKNLVGACAIGALVACGGGGGSTVTPAAPIVAAAPQLSADQAIYENLNLLPSASYSVIWSLPDAGIPATNGANYLYSSNASLALSPLTNGPQAAPNSAAQSLATTLSVPAIAPVRYLIGGKILATAVPTKAVVSYLASAVKVDTLASDGVTTVQSQVRSGFSSTPLTGLVKAAPADFAQYYHALYFNPSLLNSTATWAPDAAYVKYTATNSGDVYQVLDFSAATFGTTPTPVATGTTIAALIASGGIASASDAVTYNLANGSVSVINGITTYVATAARPNIATNAFRTYYELNGNVYTGQFIKDGTVIGGSSYSTTTAGVTTFTFSPKVQYRLNKAANAGLQSAVTF